MITGIVYKTRPHYGIVWEMIAVGTLQACGKERFARLRMLQLNGISARLGPRTCLACSQKSLEGLQLVVLALPPPPAPPACLPPRGEGRRHPWHLLAFHSIAVESQNPNQQNPRKPKRTTSHRMKDTRRFEEGEARLPAGHRDGWMGEAGDEKPSRKTRAGWLRGRSACRQLGKLILISFLPLTSGKGLI